MIFSNHRDFIFAVSYQWQYLLCLNFKLIFYSTWFSKVHVYNIPSVFEIVFHFSVEKIIQLYLAQFAAKRLQIWCDCRTQLTSNWWKCYKVYRQLRLSENHVIQKHDLRGCLHDIGATFIPGRDEKLHRVYIKPCLLGCESSSAVKLMKL